MVPLSTLTKKVYFSVRVLNQTEFVPKRCINFSRNAKISFIPTINAGIFSNYILLSILNIQTRRQEYVHVKILIVSSTIGTNVEGAKYTSAKSNATCLELNNSTYNR